MERRRGMAFSEKDSELVGQASNFAAVLAGDPERFGQSPATAAAASAVVAAFVDSYYVLTEARANGVRSAQQTATKNTNRRRMLDLLVPIYLAVQASKAIPDADKVALGVTVKRTRHTPQPVPPVEPLLTVTRVNGSVVSLAIRDPEMPARRARPAFADGVLVFAFVGEQPPATVFDFRFMASTGQTSIDLQLGPEVKLGATVWFAAMFLNSRMEHGPACAPVRATIGAGSILPAVRIAA